MTATAPTPTTEPNGDRPYTWYFIPQLRELLPKQHGRPGLTYAQVGVSNTRRAEDQGWRRVEGTATYTIRSAKGSIDMVLMAKGSIVPGVGHASGKRRCVVDIAVEQATGLRIKSRPLDTTQTNGSTPNAGQQPQHEASPALEAQGKAQSRQGAARVPSGDAAQR